MLSLLSPFSLHEEYNHDAQLTPGISISSHDLPALFTHQKEDRDELINPFHSTRGSRLSFGGSFIRRNYHGPIISPFLARADLSLFSLSFMVTSWHLLIPFPCPTPRPSPVYLSIMHTTREEEPSNRRLTCCQSWQRGLWNFQRTPGAPCKGYEAQSHRERLCPFVVRVTDSSGTLCAFSVDYVVR